MNKVLAEVTILTHKLDAIREHIERRLSVVEDETASELKYILGIISRYECVPASWSLTTPLVTERSTNDAETN